MSRFLAVMPGCIVLPETSEQEFNESMSKNFDCEVEYAVEVKTNGENESAKDRNDTFFWVTSDNPDAVKSKMMMITMMTGGESTVLPASFLKEGDEDVSYMYKGTAAESLLESVVV